MSDPEETDRTKETAASSTAAAADVVVVASSSDNLYDKLQELMSEDPRIGWPAAHKELKAKLHGWFRTGNMTMLQRLLPPKARCIVELGSWLGRSTKFLCERCPEAMVFAVDLWSNEYFSTDDHYDKEEPDFANILRNNSIYDQFLSNLTEYRLRPPADGAAAGLVPMKMDSCLALRALHKLGVKPELIYIDASHHYEFVVKDVTTCLELFPEAVLVGDDWDNEDVRRAVQDVALRENQPIYVEGGTCWTFSKSLVLDIVAKERREREKQAEQNDLVNKIRTKRGLDTELLKQLFKRKKA